MEKIKSNFTAVLSAGVGLLALIFTFIPGIKYAIEAYGAEFSTSKNGFGVMGMITGELEFSYRSMPIKGEVDFIGILAGAFSIIAFILAILLFAWGVLSLLKAFNVASVLPENLSTEKRGNSLLLATAVVNVLAFVFLLIFCLDNQESQGGASAGIYVGIGVYLTLIISVLGAGASLVLPKYLKAAPTATDTPVEE